jgi:hypothetical protein
MQKTVEVEDTNSATLRRIMPSSAMSNLVRSHDWENTSLGPLEHWSDTLVAITNLMLSSPTPTALYLGPDFISLYNDAYRVSWGRSILTRWDCLPQRYGTRRGRS